MTALARGRRQVQPPTSSERPKPTRIKPNGRVREARLREHTAESLHNLPLPTGVVIRMAIQEVQAPALEENLCSARRKLQRMWRDMHSNEKHQEVSTQACAWDIALAGLSAKVLPRMQHALVRIWRNLTVSRSLRSKTSRTRSRTKPGAGSFCRF